MPLPDLLRALLTAPGPSGYEGAPARACGARPRRRFAEVAADTLGSSVARVERHRRRPAARDRRPHRRDRPHRHAHRRRRASCTSPASAAGTRRSSSASASSSSRGTAGPRASSARSRSTCSRTRSARRSPRSRTCTSTSARKDGDEAAALVRDRRRRGDRRRAGRAAQRAASSRASMDNRLGCLRRATRRRAWSPRPAAPPGDVVAVAAVQEEITSRGARTTAFALEPDVAIVVDVTHATDAPGIEVKELGKHQFGSGPVIDARLDDPPARVRAAPRDGRGRGHPLHGRAAGRAHRHRRRRRSTSPRPASPRASCRSRCATCTRRSRWCSSTTCDAARSLIAAFAQRLGRRTSFERLIVAGGTLARDESTTEEHTMDLREVQRPLKERYREDPDASRITLSARGSTTDQPVTCSVTSGGWCTRPRPTRGWAAPARAPVRAICCSARSPPAHR